MADRRISIRLSVEDADVVRRALEQTGASGRRMAEQLAEAGRAARAADIAAYGAELDRLRAKYNPLFAAQQQYRATLEEINRAHRVGALSTEEFTRAIQREKDRFAQQIVALRGGAQTATRSFGNMRMAIQQAGFQIGDFAVQVASGQNAVHAFVQQGTQILQFFGPWGSVIGAVGAVIGALAVGFGDLTGSTEKATTATGDYNKAVEKSNELLRTAGERAADAAEKKRIEALQTVQAALAKERENLALLETLRLRQQELEEASAMAGAPGAPSRLPGIAGQIDEARTRVADLEDRLRRLSAPSLGGGENFERLAGELDKAGAAAREYQAALVAIAEARLADRISQEEANRLYEEAAKRFREARDEATGAADALKRRLQTEAEFWRENDRAARQGEEAYNRLIEQQKRREASLDQFIKKLENEAALVGQSNVEREIGRALLEAQNKLIDEQGRKQRDLTEEEKQRIADAIRTTERQKAIMQELDQLGTRAFDRIGSAITEAFVQGEGAAISFRGVVQGVISELMQDFIRLALINPIRNAIFGTAAPVLGDFTGGLFGGFQAQTGIFYGSGPSFMDASAGGFLFHGGGIVGEPAPVRRVSASVFAGARRYHMGGIASDEVPAILRRGEEVLTRSDPRHRFNGGGAPTVVYNIDARGAERGVEQRIMAALRQMEPRIVQRAVAATANARQRTIIPA